MSKIQVEVRFTDKLESIRVALALALDLTLKLLWRWKRIQFSLRICTKCHHQSRIK